MTSRPRPPARPSSILAILLASSLASADAVDPATARARVHFESALRLYDASPPDYAGALAEFRAAYREKPSAALKQNVAICLKALRRYPEAMDALTELLAEGDLTPDRRRAAQQTLADIRLLVATIRVRVTGQEGEPVPGAVVVIDGEEARGVDGAIRLGVGRHVLVARGPRYRDAPPRTLELEGGQRDVDVAIELWPLGPAVGVLVVRADPGAATWVDGHMRGQGTARLSLPPGPHHVRVITRDGDVLVGDPVVVPDETVEFAPMKEFAFTIGGGPTAKEAPPRPWYVKGGAVVAFSSMRLGASLDEPGDGTRRAFSGGAFTLSLGRKISPRIGVELLGELGTQSARYASPVSPAIEASTQSDAWLLAPAVRLSTPGKIRFSGGIGAGATGQTVSASVAERGKNGTTSRGGSGINWAFAADAGAEIDFGRIFVHAAAFAVLHGVEATRDGSDARLFATSPVLRWGGRAQLGIWF